MQQWLVWGGGGCVHWRRHSLERWPLAHLLTTRLVCDVAWGLASPRRPSVLNCTGLTDKRGQTENDELLCCCDCLRWRLMAVVPHFLIFGIALITGGAMNCRRVGVICVPYIFSEAKSLISEHVLMFSCEKFRIQFWRETWHWLRFCGESVIPDSIFCTVHT